MITLAAVIIGLVLLFKSFDIQEIMQRSLDWVQGLGALGYLVFALIYILATVLFLPGSVLTLGAGFVYGLFKGFLLVSVSSTLGAACAFLVGRYLARDWVAAKVEGNRNFKAIDEAVGEAGWKIVGLTRLSPVFPFNLLNYAYGLTRVNFREYFLASWIGMIPGTIMYVYLGTVAGSLATLGAGGSEQTTAQVVMKYVGFAATVLVTLYITRIARKALSARVDIPDEPEESSGSGGDHE
jgi:uncharacterized membrane protein YdjX (TVP38/TMEM64 family)